MSPTLSDGVQSGAALDYDSLPTRSSLLGRLQDMGDDASWRVFFDTYWRLIYNVARKSGLGEEDAQDVVQETVIAVARKMPAFRYDATKGSFKQWLLLITRRRICDHLRRLYRSLPEARAGAAATDRPEAALISDAQLDAVWEWEWRQTVFQAALSRVRLQVNPKQYQVFDYCVLQDVPPREVARMLGLNAAQVYLAKHRVSAALKRVAKELDGETGVAAGLPPAAS